MSNSNTETRTETMSSTDKAKGNEDKNKAKIRILTESGETRDLEITNGHMAYLSPEEFTIIGHDTDDGEEHVLFDKRIRLPLDEAMIENIRTHGVITPVLCRRIGQGPLLVIDGQRRVRHAREYNRRVKEGVYDDSHVMKVPFMIRSPGTDSIHIGRRVSLNEVRKDNGPLEKADLVQKLESFGMSDDEIAMTMGCSKMSVSNYRTLNDLPPEVRSSLIKNTISISQALHIARVDEKHRADALRMYESADGSSFQQTRHRIRQLTDGVEPEKTTPAPTRRLLRSMIATAETGIYKAPADLVYVIKWILGDITSNDTTGNSLGLVDWFEFSKKQKSSKKAEKQDPSSTSQKKGKKNSEKETGKGKGKGKGKVKVKEGDQASDQVDSDQAPARREKKDEKGAEKIAPKKKKKKSNKNGGDNSGSKKTQPEVPATLILLPFSEVGNDSQSGHDKYADALLKAVSRRESKNK